MTVSEKAFHGGCLLEPVGNPECVSRGWNLYEWGRNQRSRSSKAERMSKLARVSARY